MLCFTELPQFLSAVLNLAQWQHLFLLIWNFHAPVTVLIFYVTVNSKQPIKWSKYINVLPLRIGMRRLD